MDNTVATIIGTIAVAAFSGLTFLAYKHPKAYWKLSIFLNAIIILGWVGGFSCSLSNQWASIAAERVTYDLCSGKTYEIRKAIEAYAVPTWFFWTLIAGSLYVLFLLTFPLWLSDEHPTE